MISGEELWFGEDCAYGRRILSGKGMNFSEK